MTALWNVTAEALPGTHIELACEQARALAGILGRSITLKFNGHELPIYPDDDAAAVAALYAKRTEQRRARG